MDYPRNLTTIEISERGEGLNSEECAIEVEGTINISTKCSVTRHAL